ncbi:ABC transporter ATP-binding protein [Thermoleophilia bacterium SCSIO 60948]|nr:ABC transporter ATP-binding protein [Thermoleophilia bacterium SCSIO 60948]
MPVIEASGLRKRYGEKTAVADVSFEVERGEIFGILGPNGAGKTTTVECLVGLRRRDGGTATVLGTDPAAATQAFRSRVGIQLQDSALPGRLKLEEAIDLYASFYPDPLATMDLVDRLGLGEVRRTRFSALSGGQRQRLSIALALVGRPEVAILDELSTGLDPRARRDVWALIEETREAGTTIVLVSHGMEEVERLCDRVAVIVDGRVAAAGPPSELGGGGRTQTMRLRPSVAVDPASLERVDGVEAVSAEAGELAIELEPDSVATVISALAEQGAEARELRIDRRSMEDAYLELTDTREESTR